MKKMIDNIFTVKKIFILLLLVQSFSFAQFQKDSIIASEKLQIKDTTSIKDTLTKTDTTKKSDIDSVIYSSSKDSIIFIINKKKMDIYGSGYLSYKDTKLKSSKIFVDFETSNVEAYGRNKDSTSDELIETPVLDDKGEEYKGVRMRYNFKTSRGFITYAKTKEAEASYSGAKIKKVDKETYFIEKGIYSTCDNEEPHYYFYGDQMKMIQKEQVVGRWIWLTFGNVPFPIPIPFVVFPLQTGRRSGIIAPTFGERFGYGKSFTGGGYFWAMSDYMDLNLTGDYYTKGGYALHSRFRYTKRYDFTGNLEGDYSNFHLGDNVDLDREEQKEWRLRFIHNQAITPTSRLDVNLEFMTGNYFSLNSASYAQLLKREIISNATFYKNWEESGSSMSMNYERRQDLQNGDVNEVLPRISFSKSQFYPFKPKNSIVGDQWYEMIGINYSGLFQNNRVKKGNDLQIRGGIKHNASVSVSPKIGYFNISPYFNYDETWYNKRVQKENIISPFTGKDSVITNDINEINFVRTFNTGVSASTKLYGIVQPNKFGVSAVRHILTPSISYNFKPDFSKPKWGYYDSYSSSNGETFYYNKFEREIFGGASAGENQAISFSLSNVFEMKTTVDPTDTTSKEKKFQLLNANANISYNFAADSLRFSDLYLSYNTQIGDLFGLSGSSVYSLYDFDETNNHVVNKFLFKEGKGLLRLKSFGFSVSFSISGEKLKSEKDTTQVEEESIFPVENAGYKGLYEDKQADFSIPWDVSLNYNYSLNKISPSQSEIYSTINGGLNFNLTKNWKISLSGSYDFRNKQFAAPQVVITRDLHCWLMNFTWNPLGTYQGYRLEIRVKAPQLQDLKLTKTDRFFGGRR